MFNQLHKLEYIDGVDLSKEDLNALRRSFALFTYKENELCKDLATFSREEIKSVLSNIEGETAEEVQHYLELLSGWSNRYITLTNGDLSQINYKNWDIDEIKVKIGKPWDPNGKKFISRKTILAYCEALPNPRDRAILLGAYEGIRGYRFSDMLEISKEDVGDDKIFIKNQNKWINFTPELMKYIKDAMKETEYVSYYVKNASGERKALECRYELIDNGCAIKSVAKGTLSNSSVPIRNAYMRALQFLGLTNYITSMEIYDSGRVDWVLRNTDEGMRPIDTVYDKYDELRERFPGNYSRISFVKTYIYYLS